MTSKSLANTGNLARLDLMERTSQTDLQLKRLGRYRELVDQSREARTKGMTALGITGSGAIIVSINSLSELYQVKGQIHYPAILIVSWVLLFVPALVAIRFRFWLATSLYFAAVFHIGNPDKRERPEDEREDNVGQLHQGRKMSNMAYASFLAGILCLMLFMGINLLASRPEQLPKPTSASMPTTMPGSAPPTMPAGVP